MKNSLEQIKFDIINWLSNVNKILYVNDRIEKHFTPNINKKINISFASDSIEARCRFRKNFKSYTILNVSKEVDLGNSEKYDAILLSEEGLNKYYKDLLNFDIIILSVDKEFDSNLKIIKESFEYLYYFNTIVKNGCFFAVSDDSINSKGILIASKKHLQLEEFYAISLIKKERNLNNENAENFDSDKFWINYLNSEIKRIQKNSYLILGPLIVAKRLASIWLKRVPAFVVFCKLIKAYNEGGVKLIIKRIKNFNKNKNLNKKQEYTFIYESNNEYLDFDSHYQENIDFSNNKTDIKMLAFYLPQFHTFKENDEWWGKGFTEWTNTKTAKPMFKGQYQPRTPHNDFGFYDLNDISTLKKQALLAKQHGIYGFCFYYYWFSGKRLMEKPVDMLLKHKEIDLPFCLCWANENWTRAWDGQSKDILIKQNYSDEDNKKFIIDLKKYIDDERYIKIKGKPLIVVYNPGEIPDCKKSFSTWREVAKECGIGEILIWTCRTANNTAKNLNIEEFIDAEVEFPPHNTWLNDFAVKDIDLKGRSASIFNYQKLVETIKYNHKIKNDLSDSSVPLHRSCMMAWDNVARRKNNWFTYHNFSLRSLYDWVMVICAQARRDVDNDERFVFINAWNEWAEGTYLEPDEKYGYANINTVSKALFGLPYNDNLLIINDNNIVKDNYEFNKKIAIQIHMYYLETLEETIDNINKIPFSFDCYISTDSNEKAKIIEFEFSKKCKCSKLVIEVFENRGRDVLPFILQLKDRIDKYDYICHIHSKKTIKTSYGNDWRKYIFRNLFGSGEYIKTLFYHLENHNNLGMIFPKTFPVLEFQARWGGNLNKTEEVLRRLNTDIGPTQYLNFPVGNMFIAKTEAIRQMFKINLSNDDFPTEDGQQNSTLAHAIERSWVFLINDYGFNHNEVFNNTHLINNTLNKKRIAFYAHYNKDDTISEEDLESLKAYKNVFDDVIFISNSLISKKEYERLYEITNHIFLRDNEGYDFGAWKFGINKFGYNKLSQYDQVILINNSTLKPIYNIEYVFNEMSDTTADFWGITLFPEIKNERFLDTKVIAEHLQSYFIVFEKNIINSGAIEEFFDNVKDMKTFKDAIKEGEVELTTFMKKKGFKYLPYIKECYYLSEYLNDYSIPYNKPATLLYLGSPFIKKKAFCYMDAFEKQKLDELLNKIE